MGQVFESQTVLLEGSGLTLCRHEWQSWMSGEGHEELITAAECVSEALKAPPRNSRATATPAMLDSSSFLYPYF